MNFFTRSKGLKTSRIPPQWQDVTPEWMTAAIASHHPEARVDEAKIVMRDDGTNRRARFGLTYSAGTGPTSLFLKAHAANHRFVHLRNGNLFNEARLFAAEVPLGVDHPIVYKSIVDRLRLDFLLVMEDLTQRGADPRDATRPMTVEQVANGLRGLARLHSLYWGFSKKTHPKLDWVKNWKPSQGWQVGLKRCVPIGLERAGTNIPEAIAAYSGDEIVEYWARYVTSLTQGTMTFLHGDAHIGNTYVLADGDVGFLDWQVVRRGNWSQDVGYFLVGSLTEEDRRAHEKELIEEYRNALDIPEDQRPSSEEAWLTYRTTPAYGMAIWLSTLGTNSYQAQEISLALAQRFSTAFVELDTLSALDAVGV
ncbi:phosphotransferase [Pseudomaricurvus sp.]|uniref:phosphotransferase n=1 Tax=Pseudomaricurvus sp. TaxID=2004510 RepID=UPI003F6B6A00